MQMCLFTRSYKQMRDLFTFENQCKYHASIVQTKYEILISRKQVLRQQILYINEFIYSSGVQNKYLCMEIFLEVYCCNITF